MKHDDVGGIRMREVDRKTEWALRMYFQWEGMPWMEGEAKRLCDRVAWALTKVKPGKKYKDFIELRYKEGVTIERLAEIYQVEPGAIQKKKRGLVRALAPLVWPDDEVKRIAKGIKEV